VGVMFIYLWYRDVRKAWATRSWPVTSGHVLTSRVESRRGRSKRNNTNITVYDPQVVYEYMVNEVSYQGKQIGIGGGFATRTQQDVERKIAPYAAGASVRVFYDPTDPQQAVLEHSVSSGVAFLLLGGFILLVLVLLFFPWNRVL